MADPGGGLASFSLEKKTVKIQGINVTGGRELGCVGIHLGEVKVG